MLRHLPWPSRKREAAAGPARGGSGGLRRTRRRRRSILEHHLLELEKKAQVIESQKGQIQDLKKQLVTMECLALGSRKRHKTESQRKAIGAGGPEGKRRGVALTHPNTGPGGKEPGTAGTGQPDPGAGGPQHSSG